MGFFFGNMYRGIFYICLVNTRSSVTPYTHYKMTVYSKLLHLSIRSLSPKICKYCVNLKITTTLYKRVCKHRHISSTGSSFTQSSKNPISKVHFWVSFLYPRLGTLQVIEAVLLNSPAVTGCFPYSGKRRLRWWFSHHFFNADC